MAKSNRDRESTDEHNIKMANLSVWCAHECGKWHALEAKQKAVVEAEAVLFLALLLEPKVAGHGAAPKKKG